MIAVTGPWERADLRSLSSRTPSQVVEAVAGTCPHAHKSRLSHANRGTSGVLFGVLGVAAGTGRLEAVAPRQEVQGRVFGGRSRHWLGKWVEEVSGGGAGSVEVGAGRARGSGP